MSNANAIESLRGHQRSMFAVCCAAAEEKRGASMIVARDRAACKALAAKGLVTIKVEPKWRGHTEWTVTLA